MIQTSLRSWTKKQRAEDDRDHDIGGDHQRPLPHPVDEKPEGGCDQARDREHEEHEPGLRVRPRQSLHPDPEHEVHRPVAEERESLARPAGGVRRDPGRAPAWPQLPVAVGRIGKPMASTCTGAEPSGRRSGSTRSTYGCTSSTIASPSDSSSSGVRYSERLAQERRFSPAGLGRRLAGEPVAQPVQVALEDHRRQGRGGGGRLRVGADLLPLVAYRPDPPGARPARPVRGLLEEAVLAKLAQVERAVGRREPEGLGGRRRGQLPLAGHELHELDAGRMREGAHHAGIGQPALLERHVSKDIFREAAVSTDEHAAAAATPRSRPASPGCGAGRRARSSSAPRRSRTRASAARPRP